MKIRNHRPCTVQKSISFVLSESLRLGVVVCVYYTPAMDFCQESEKGDSILTQSVHLFCFLFRKLTKNYQRFSIPHVRSPRPYSFSTTQKPPYGGLHCGEGGNRTPVQISFDNVSTWCSRFKCLNSLSLNQQNKRESSFL